MNQFARPGLAVTELPSFNENDKGKVLTINSESGALGWEEGSGGGSSGGGVLVVNVIPEGEEKATMDKTWQEIYDAPFSVARIQTGQTSVMLCQINNIVQHDSEYSVSIFVPTASDPSVIFAGMTFLAESANDYPTMGK